MPYKNGDLPPHILAPAGGGHLRKDAAAAFNAMNAESVRQGKGELHATAPQDTYRDLQWQEHYYALYKSGHGNLAAVPGTSNHGWGLAIDLAFPWMREVVDEIGEPFGWAKKWSDAPSEWWHLRYRPGVWHPPAGKGPERTHRPARQSHAPAHQGHAPSERARRAMIAVAQQLLRAHGFRSVRVDGRPGRTTALALRQFQQRAGLPQTGRPDQATLAALRRGPAAAGGGPGAPSGPAPHGLEQAWVQTAAIARGPNPPGWTQAWVPPASGAPASPSPPAPPATAPPHGGRRRSRTPHRTGAR